MEWKNVGKDTVNSPCIDAEYLDSDYSNDPRNSENWIKHRQVWKY
jgi:hypothetical protein